MASTIDKKKNEIQTTTAAAQSTPAAASDAAASAAQPAITPYTGLSGLSDNTSQQLGRFGQGYQASENVTAAQQYLQNVVNGKPGDYQSQYKGQLESLYNQVMNRDPFSFNLNGDALYNQYKDQYTQLGQQAMMDTMGQAAAMTGGYGNSYAQTAGQQAYQGYLTQLNNIVPELYQMAYDRYNQEGTNLQNKLSLTQGLEDSAYGKYRDTVSDWNAERAYASEDYWNQYNADYSDYANMLNYWNTIAQQENSQYNTDRQMAYSQAMAILQTGKMPSSDLLAMAGISKADANSLKSAYTKKSSSGGGSSSKSSGGSSSKSSSDTTLSASAMVTYNSFNNAINRGVDKSKLTNALKTQVSNGKMTQSEANTIKNRLGL